MIPFETVWMRIKTHSGEEFSQIRGGKFHYEVRGDYLILDRTNQNIAKSHFEEAFG